MNHSFKALTPVSFLDRASNAYPSDIAIRAGRKTLTYRQLHRRACVVMDMCLHDELKLGGRVALLTRNSIDGIVCHFGVPASGGVLVSLNPHLNNDTLKVQLISCEAKILFVSASIYSQRAHFIEQLNSLCVIVIDDGGAFEKSPWRGLNETEDNARALDYEFGRLDRLITDEQLPAVMNFTSGTTGDPKGVLYSHRAAYLHAIGQVIMFELNRQSRYFWSLPMFHVNGWGHMWAIVAAGAVQVVEDYFDVVGKNEIAAIIQDYRINRLAGSPRLLNCIDFISLKKSTCESLQLMTGGAAPPRSLVDKTEKFGIKLIHQYGLNETCGPLLVAERDANFSDLSEDERAGKLLRQGIEGLHATGSVSVRDQVSGREVPKDGRTVGEIVLSGNTIALGYSGGDESSRQAFREDGFHSGDLAVVHPEGDIEIVDRIKDLIHVDTQYGWENVSSIEIENVLLQSGLLEDCAVVGYVDHKGKKKIAAFVEAGMMKSPYDLIKSCEEFLPEYKRPSLIAEEPIPKTKTGKVRKEVLRSRISELKELHADTGVSSVIWEAF